MLSWRQDSNPSDERSRSTRGSDGQSLLLSDVPPPEPGEVPVSRKFPAEVGRLAGLSNAKNVLVLKGPACCHIPSSLHACFGAVLQKDFLGVEFATSSHENFLFCLRWDFTVPRRRTSVCGLGFLGWFSGTS